MGRRSRKRGLTTPRAASPSAVAPPRAPSPRARMRDAPKAPWSPFPLVELCVLAALVLLVLGILADGGRRGVLLACGLALITLAGLELALREHLTGFRSHSTLLAAACGLAVAVPLSLLTDLPKLAVAVVAVVVFGAVLALARAAFRGRSGGLSFRA
jgi:hypothetical protein